MSGAVKAVVGLVVAPVLLVCGLAGFVVAALATVTVGCSPSATSSPDPDAAVSVAAGPAATTGVAGCDSGWVLPLPAGRFWLSSGYGPRWGAFHYGQDFAAAAGTPIFAAAAGVVVSAGCTSPFCDRPGQVGPDGMPRTEGCGFRVQIQHPGRVATTYCHAQTLAVQAGQPVHAGQVIGWVGSTGHSTGNHLHFQVHLNAPPISNETTTDPVAYLRNHGLTV